MPQRTLNAMTPAIGAEAEVLAVARRTLTLEMDGLAAVTKALDGDLGEKLRAAVDLIHDCGGRVIVTGIGKSGHIGRKIAATLASTGTAAYFVHSAEASHGDLGMIHDSDVVLALSWSGETAELSDVIDYTHRFQVPLIAITSRETSNLARSATIALVLPAMPEACPNGQAPTTSTLMQLAIGDVLATCLLSRKGFSATDFHRYHPGGKLGARLKRASDVMVRGEAIPLAGEDALLSQAILVMSSKRLGVTGVVDGAGDLVGLLTDGDLRRAFQNGFADAPVSAVMTKTPITVPGDTLVQEVLARMNAASITVIFVMEGRRPVGVIHIHELLRIGVA
jgi:arabinose-5-phosphate isomerase